MEKKKWEKPKLIVLVRGRPEECCVAIGCLGSGTSEAVWIDVCNNRMDLRCGPCFELKPAPSPG